MAEPAAAAQNPAVDLLAQKTIDVARNLLGNDLLEVVTYRGETTLIVPPHRIVEICRVLRDAPDLRYTFLADLTAVDWPDRDPRYDVVYHLMSMETRAVVRLKTRVGAEGEESPALPSVTDVWASANWCEREVFDLFGINFEGHPDLLRLLMPVDWVGHPLRKDYPLTGITLPDPHWAGQIPYGDTLPEGTGKLTLRTPEGIMPEKPDIETKDE